MREYNVRASHNIITFLLVLLIALVTAAMMLIPVIRKWNTLGGPSILEAMNIDGEEDETVFNSVLRFHIRANSDSEEDQRVKLLVKEQVMNAGEKYFSKEQFPVKKYGDMTFPAGEYEALRMDLGDAEGKNWWCMIYPSLCFVDVTTGVVPQESKEEFEHLLPAEDYEDLLATPEEDVEIKCGILEWIKKGL